MSTNEQRIEALEQDVRLLKMALAGGGTSTAPRQATTTANAQTATNNNQNELDDSKLGESWADQEIRKDPPLWISDGGESYVGKTMSMCPPAYLDALSDFFEWKADKGRKEDPPRLNNKGKPWHESDTFNAKLARAWARRMRKQGPGKAAVRPAPKPAEAVPDFGPPAEDEIPF